MDSNDPQALAIALQDSLRQQTPSIRISRAASLTESGFILPVIRSLRTACLLSTLTASQSVIAALQSTLIYTTCVVIAVHEPSQQVFIVNRGLFVKRWCNADRRNLFYAIDADGREELERVKTSMPEELTMLLSELYEKLRSKLTTGSTEVIMIKSVEGSIHGVALAGWLLEYDVIYFYDDKEPDSTRNSLAGISLVLIVVKLDEHPLYQYTFPLSIASAVCSSMTIKGSSVQDICRATENRLVERSLGCSLEVTYQHIVRERVAL